MSNILNLVEKEVKTLVSISLEFKGRVTDTHFASYPENELLNILEQNVLIILEYLPEIQLVLKDNQEDISLLGNMFNGQITNIIEQFELRTITGYQFLYTINTWFSPQNHNSIGDLLYCIGIPKKALYALKHINRILILFTHTQMDNEISILFLEEFFKQIKAKYNKLIVEK